MTVSALSLVCAALLSCTAIVLVVSGSNDNFGTYLTYVRDRGYCVNIWKDRTTFRTSVPLNLPPLRPWTPSAAWDVDAWNRARRQTWTEYRFLGFWFFSGEVTITGLGQHPFLPGEAATGISYYAMDHAVAIPHWASIPACLVLPALWVRQRRRGSRLSGFEPGIVPVTVTAAVLPCAPVPR